MKRIRNLLLFGIGAAAMLIGLALLFRQQLQPIFGINIDAGSGGRADLVVRDGYEADVFAEGLRDPRFMAVAPDGTLIVAERGADRVIALPDADRDGGADEIVEIGTGYGGAHDLAFEADGSLLVAGQETLWRLTLDGLRETSREAVVEDLPTGGHSTKSVAVLPSGEILLSIGSSCNACEEEDERRATVQLVNEDGMRPFMVGLRNAVGLWVDPDTGRGWATNMGRDRLGDDLPPETLYELVEGADAGWPRCHAGTLPDPEFGGAADSCAGVAMPAATFPAHTAPLALVGWGGDVYVALHGSWNSSVKVGYAVWRIPWSDDGPAGEPEPFATGFLPDGVADALGRPAGLAVGGDGALYISDDKAGFVYRIAAVGD